MPTQGSVLAPTPAPGHEPGTAAGQPAQPGPWQPLTQHSAAVRAWAPGAQAFPSSPGLGRLWVPLQLCWGGGGQAARLSSPSEGSLRPHRLHK